MTHREVKDQENKIQRHREVMSLLYDKFFIDNSGYSLISIKNIAHIFRGKDEEEKNIHNKIVKHLPNVERVIKMEELASIIDKILDDKYDLLTFSYFYRQELAFKDAYSKKDILETTTPLENSLSNGISVFS
jgi:hypothetical protein